MNTSRLKSGLWLCFAMIIITVLLRLIPHPYNFTPIGALGLFSGAYLTSRKYWLVPLFALLISDSIIGFYHPITMASVYFAFLLCAIIGRVWLTRQRNTYQILSASITCSTGFFLLSNFGDWLSGINYPLTWEGLSTCYIAAIPFFGNTLAGDLIYAILLFGMYETAIFYLKNKDCISPA